MVTSMLTGVLSTFGACQIFFVIAVSLLDARAARSTPAPPMWLPKTLAASFRFHRYPLMRQYPATQPLVGVPLPADARCPETAASGRRLAASARRPPA